MSSPDVLKVELGVTYDSPFLQEDLLASSSSPSMQGRAATSWSLVGVALMSCEGRSVVFFGACMKT